MNNYWNTVKNYALRLLVLLFLYSFTRLVFLWCNASLIGDTTGLNLIGGLRFDLAAIALINLPFTLLILFPVTSQFTNSRWFRTLFTLINFIGIAANLCDCAYYSFTLKRTTSDLFSTQGIGKDILNLLPSFIADFWYLFLLAAVLFGLMGWTFKKLPFASGKPKTIIQWITASFFYLLILASSIVAYRGGLQLRPINIVTAGSYGSGKQIALVLNTPFTLIRSATQKPAQEFHFFSDTEVESIFPMSRTFNGDGTMKKNVVLIILESFGEEYIGALSRQQGYTPFLDSLIPFCTRPEIAYANGRKSIEAMPAITASIPTLSDVAFVSSPNAGNEINALPSILSKAGYSTSFFHGGHNGTMGFDTYAKLAGYHNYYGMNEYPNPEHYDGKWGIPDEPFLNWFGQNLNKTKQPFFSTIFTLSSHHPFTVPDKYRNILPKGKLPIHQSVAYADLALRKFFAQSKDQAWFNNTIFVITGDHTSLSDIDFYSSPTGVYRIPFLIYSPDQKAETIPGIAQQLDITPTILDLLGYKGQLRFFGKSLFDSTTTPWNLNYLEGSYQFIEYPYVLKYNGDNGTGLYNVQTDPPMELDEMKSNEAKARSLEQRAKAIIQQYNNRQIRNSLTRP